ncbi:MAG: DNA polymerase III subunit gamma/tau [Bdellovibrionales bacterium]|nr:DNA polymerase III subunit gamma/tau [Bdellovibrionales bacterium]
MSYVVLARKWRPAQFADIVGQGNIVRTLMNAVKKGRIHQAHLFTGSRGIGKTSIARIFAKVIRCPEAKDEGENGGLSSCDHCASCREIAAGSSVDVIEIDGASNNGVDAVREIRESAKYLPSSGSRKIYIIDEVHMLTTAAFNALLKTLEEPPPHVIFVFATTEPHKIPATILSRVQRFDFRRVTAAQVQERLTQVTKAEGIAADPGALALVGRAAEGSMRDALSLLDQVIAFAGQTITIENVRESIGLIQSQTLLGILRGVLERKPLPALALVEEAFQQGHDLRVLSRSLIELVHAAILAKVGAQRPSGLELSADEWDEIRSLSALRPLEELELIFQALHHGTDWIARSPQPKIVLDVLLVKCASAEALVPVEKMASAGSAGRGPAPSPVAATIPVAEPMRSAPERAAPEAVATPPAVPNLSAPLSWEEMVRHFRAQRPRLASLLEHASSHRMPAADSVELEVRFNPDNSFKAEQLKQKDLADEVNSFCTGRMGRTVRVAVHVDASAGESQAQVREREAREREESARRAIVQHPVVQEARALFGGELGPVERAAPMGGPGA